MSEKHTIRNGITVAVVSGIILAILLSSWLRGLIASAGRAVWSLLVTLGHLLIHRLDTPVWLLLLLVVLAIPIIRKLVRALLRKGPDTTDYKTDTFFGVTWRWQHGYGGINSLCRCDQELVYHEQRSDYNEVCYLYPPEFTQFVCERCNVKSERVPGGKADAVARVEREIRRCIRTGEWQRKVGTEQEN